MFIALGRRREMLWKEMMMNESEVPEIYISFKSVYWAALKITFEHMYSIQSSKYTTQFNKIWKVLVLECMSSIL